MACVALSQGFTPKTCKTVSGTKSFILAEFANIDLANIVVTAGIVTALPRLSGLFFKYKQRPEVANWKEDGTSGLKEGTFKYETTATFDLNTLATSVKIEADKLLKTTLIMIAEDNDGTFWLLGQDYGMEVSKLGFDGGTDFASFRGGKLELKGMGFTPVYEVNPAIIEALFAPYVPA